MTDDSPADHDLDRLFLTYLQQIDQDGGSNLEEFASSRNLSEDITRQLRELAEAEKIVQEMAGPQLGEQHELFAKRTPDNPDTDETILVGDQTSEIPFHSSPPQGATLGDYEVLEELGRGGMGVVYKANQVNMNREVALKMISAGCLASEEDVQRFYFEAQAAGKLNHPAIVQVHQVGEIDGHHYFTMEYIEGDTLSSFVRREGLSATQIGEMMVKIAEAVDFAHAHGLLHRDLKPSNILVDTQGNPRITDFGLAKDMNSGEQLTNSGSALGTPSYMPPEQARALRDEITCRSDVYSLGAILYFLLTGRPPFKEESLIETLTQVIYAEPVPPRDINPSCPRSLEAICLKCLKKSPADRYGTAAELVEDLQRFVRGDRVLARQSRWYDRVWQWLRNVPMIAAMLGRKSASSTRAHVRIQWATIVLAASIVLGYFLIPMMIELSRLSVIDLATGSSERSSYYQIGESLAETLRDRTDFNVEVHISEGAVASHGLLLSGERDFAFLQANALESKRLKVLAPLYPEAVLVMVRNGVPAQNIQDLKNMKIALGTSGSGMRLSSQKLLDYYGLSEDDLRDVNHDYSALERNESLQGAIVTIKDDNPDLVRLLKTGQFRLLKLPDIDKIPDFRGIQLSKKLLQMLPDGVVPEGGNFVPGTFAILAVRESTPDRYVKDFLEALYAEDGVSEHDEHVMSLNEAAKWEHLDYHRAARRFFENVGEPQPK